MDSGKRTSHGSFSATVGLAAFVVAAGALVLLGCATSPEPEKKSGTAIEKPQTREETGEEAPATVEKPAPAGAATEAGEEKKPAGEEAARTPVAAPPEYPGTAEHIQQLEERLKPLRSVPSKGP